MVGEHIRELRNQRALRLEDLARQAGITPTALSRIENGVAVPRPSTRRKIADALEVDVAELTAGVTTDRVVDSEDEIVPIARLRELDRQSEGLIELQARQPLQQVAEDILAAFEANGPNLADQLTELERASRQIQGRVAPLGRALADFIGGLRESRGRTERSTEPSVASRSAELLIKAVREPGAEWCSLYRETCHDFADVLIWSEPAAFRKAVTTLLLQHARLGIDELENTYCERTHDGGQAREAVSALTSVLTVFNLANSPRHQQNGSPAPMLGMRRLVRA